MPCREAKQEDVPALARLSVDAWRTAYRGVMPSSFLDALSVEDAQARWKGTVGEGHPSVVVYEQDRQLTASCYVGPSRDPDADPATAEIIALNVNPDHWRHGLGSKLTAFVLDRLRVQGFRSVTLWVLRDNVRARRFYEALRFQPDGTERVTSALIGSPLHELRYRITLS
jgi:RimJ/RimL family protein N-acetyltransferase